MITARIRTLSAALIACGFAFPAMADWNVDKDTSALHFLSTKNAQVTEVHKFDRFEGSLSDNGELSIEVDLASVNTAIDIRNSRMQEMLFNVSEFATATFVADLPATLTDLENGDVVMAKVDGILTLHGKAVPTTFTIKASKLDDDTMTVSTVSPTLIKTDAFGLTEGVEALQKIAGLKSITTTVPITFSVTFTR